MRQFLQTIADSLPCFIASIDTNLCYRFANARYLDWFGKTPEEIVGRPVISILGERLFALNEPQLRAALAGEEQNFERSMHKAGGTVLDTWANYIPERDENGLVCGVLMLMTDITPTKVAESRVRDSEARYRLLAENVADMVFQLDRNMVRLYVSPASREILGYGPEELIGVKPVNQVHPDDAQRVELTFRALLDGGVQRDTLVNRIRHRDGRWVWIEADLKAARDPQTGVTTSIVGALRDISIRKAIEDQLMEANRRLEALARQDGLTGLANRRFFDEAMGGAWDALLRGYGSLALVILDVDAFKRFNDDYGRLAGDECLRQVGAAIGGAVHRTGDLAARYGGEEFVVLLPETDEAGAAGIAERIRQAVVRLNIEHRSHPFGMVTISAGVAAAAPGSAQSPDILTRLADRALYRAKEGGRNRVVRASEMVAGYSDRGSNAA